MSSKTDERIRIGYVEIPQNARLSISCTSINGYRYINLSHERLVIDGKTKRRSYKLYGSVGIPLTNFQDVMEVMQEAYYRALNVTGERDGINQMAGALSKKIIPSSIHVTDSISQILEQATRIGAKQLTNWDDDDVDALDYMDDDDPRRMQWQTALRIAQFRLFDYMLSGNFKKKANTSNIQSLDNAGLNSLKDTVESLKELVLALVDYHKRRDWDATEY